MQNELTWNERREWAKELYIQSGKTNQEIALTVSTDEATLRAWITEGQWAGIRRCLLISKERQLQRYYRLIEALEAKSIEDETNVKTIELITKVTTAISNLENEDATGYIVETGKQFTSWLLLRDAGFSKKVSTHFDAFIKHKLS